MKKSCFKIIKSHCPNGVESKSRTAMEIISDHGGVVLDVGYQVSPAGEHCVGIVFEADSDQVARTYHELDSMPEPPDAGTTVRRNR